MELLKLKTNYKDQFYKSFENNPEHQWIVKNKDVQKCFQLLFDEFRDEHFKFFTKNKVSFIYSHAELSFAVGNLKNEFVVVIFPDLFKMMSTTLITEASATLAHELGHIFYRHHEKAVNRLKAQIEADSFATELGFKEDLKRTLLRFSHLPEVQYRLEFLK